MRKKKFGVESLERIVDGRKCKEKLWELLLVKIQRMSGQLTKMEKYGKKLAPVIGAYVIMKKWQILELAVREMIVNEFGLQTLMVTYLEWMLIVMVLLIFQIYMIKVENIDSNVSMLIPKEHLMQ